MTIITSKDLGKHEEFDLEATLSPDYDSTPYDADCYDSETIAGWKSDQWSYVGAVVTASREGVELGEASLWGLEYGMLCGRFIDPLDEDLNGYQSDLIDEAITEARTKLAKLLNKEEEK
jgi:hypothetical protein